MAVRLVYPVFEPPKNISGEHSSLEPLAVDYNDVLFSQLRGLQHLTESKI